jgi:hypothetical protein
MLPTIRRWHWLLLHQILGIPDRDHARSDLSLSALLHSHPPVPAHHRRHEPLQGPSLQKQLTRERSRQTYILKGWQRRIGATFDRSVAGREAESSQHSEF